MQHTLVAVFDNRDDARKAMDELLNSGFTRQEVRLSEGDASNAGAAPVARSGANDEADDDVANDDGSFGSSIKHFFSNLFGTGHSEHAHKYSEAVSRGHYVLTLSADGEPEVERAADIIERYGPIDIDEQSAQWGSPNMATDAMRMGADAQQQSASMSRQSTQGSQGGMQDSTPGASQQRAPQSDANSANPALQEELRISQRDLQRGGVRVFQNEVEAQQINAGDSDDIYYRSHFHSMLADTGAPYDDYAPAYHYGSSMAGNARYLGREWDDVEAQLRGEWETRYPGSAWEKMKAAVRHGWDKITS